MRETHVERLSFGMNGSLVIGSTESAPEGEYCAIQFITAGELSALESDSIVGAVGFTFPAGFVLYGPYSALTTASGCEVVAYKG